MKDVKPLKPKVIPLINSLNKILAQDIYAKIDIPPFDNSAMDGYAIISSDTEKTSAENPVFLKIIGEVNAGNFSRIKLKSGCAMKITTGAPIPSGCDAVVRKEDTELHLTNIVKIFKRCRVGEDLREKGEDIKKGELILQKGEQIGKFEMGAIASLGQEKVLIYPTPRVGIISTGNELIEPGKKISAGKIYNSNAYTLWGLIKDTLAEPIYLGIAKDDPDRLQNVLQKAAKTFDIIITSGGVSVGEYDLVKDVVNKLGKVEIWKVAMRPGHPLAYGKIAGKIFFGLPGNPVSVIVSFLQFVMPIILKMSGHSHLFLEEKEVVIDEDIKKKKGLMYFLRGKSYLKNGILHGRTTGPQGSGILKSFLLADILLVLGEEIEFVKKGEKVKAQVL